MYVCVCEENKYAKCTMYENLENFHNRVKRKKKNCPITENASLPFLYPNLSLPSMITLRLSSNDHRANN